MAQMNFWDRLFPPKYNFYEMIARQAQVTASGIAAFRVWLHNPTSENAYLLRSLIREADTIRYEMEAQLIDAFVTPFDRQDIYSLSVDMDRVIESAQALMELMIAYEVQADDAVYGMTLDLEEGVNHFASGVAVLAKDPLGAEQHIAEIRRCQAAVEEGYRRGSAALFKTSDMIKVMKYREIYRHVQDAAIYLGYTADILHKIVVRIA